MHPDLERLIQAIAADGVVTAKERAVLHKKAKELGADTDELDVMVDGIAHGSQPKTIRKEVQRDSAPTLENLLCPSCGSSDLSIPKNSTANAGHYVCSFCGTLAIRPVRQMVAPPKHATRVSPVSLIHLRSLMRDHQGIFVDKLPNTDWVDQTTIIEQLEIAKVGTDGLLAQLGAKSKNHVLLRLLAQKHIAIVRNAVAKNPYVPADTLIFLSKDRSLRKTILSNDSLPASVLDEFAKTYNFETDSRIGKQKNLSLQAIQTIIHRSNSTCPPLLKPVHGKKLKDALRLSPHYSRIPQNEFIKLDGTNPRLLAQIQANPQSCFPGSTMVSTPGGFTQIGTISLGDWILSYGRHGELKSERVTRVLRYNKSETLEIHLDGNSENSVLAVTPHHTLRTRDKWVRASHLTIGRQLLCIDPQTRRTICRKITKIERGKTQEVFNLHTTGMHNFIADGVVAHNFSEFRLVRTLLHIVFMDPWFMVGRRRDYSAQP